MITTEKVYKLISTLTSAEKRYFNIMVTRQEGAKQQYITLFELMAGSIATDLHGEPVFTLDEEGLIQRMRRKGVAENQFHVVRYQLAQMLFKALRLMQEENNQEDAIRILLKDAKVLERRGQFEWAVEKLEEALEIARKFEFHALGIEALYNLVYLSGQSDSKRYAENIRAYLQEIEQIAQRYLTENQYFSLQYQALVLFRTRKSPASEEFSEACDQLAANPALHREEPGESFSSKIFRYHTQATLADIKSGHQGAQPWHARILELWESEAYRHLQQERPRQFIVHLFNYIGFSIILGDFSVYERHFVTLDQFKSPSFDDEAEAFQNKVLLQQLYYLNRGELEQAKAIIPAIEKGLTRYAAKINKSRLFSIRYHIILTYFALGQYDKALAHSETLLRYGKSEQRRDVQLFTNILRHITFLELEDFDGLDRLASSVKNNMDPGIPVVDFERINLIQLGQLAKLQLDFPEAGRKRKEAMAPVFAQFESDLLQHQKSFPGPPPLGFEEILLWVRSKITGKTFRELMLKKEA